LVAPSSDAGEASTSCEKDKARAASKAATEVSFILALKAMRGEMSKGKAQPFIGLPIASTSSFFFFLSKNLLWRKRDPERLFQIDYRYRNAATISAAKNEKRCEELYKTAEGIAKPIR